ncbi:catalytic domain of components of various dehydrogenase complexes [Acidimicrobium ferrooxidans DSM 10331]|uniref:Dihydrolipoamide acetyltransferase component of pyruvate dehydrogenase complex n=1 Tax=Acidimicrobium ferrooxidans (strain DSM 10331 / JCM 15462 / NBRC 103882 / ICP) TaxID=525909 RepID=C7LYG3_ACIFD|nr:dihydrolipoamide acetyltransferase family protein [Acidimicrobium ferrooxidans]ACU53771.1 catalytic domain of components of various dehydrogenase complexes [Acidimicrobium ferrooxidans DSM 10331]
MEWKFPDVGEGLHEAQVVAWHVHEGDAIERDAPLVDVETDKSVVTIPAPVAGTVEKILFHEGDTVHVGEVVVVFGDGSAPAPSPLQPTASPAHVPAPPVAPAPTPASEPLARGVDRGIVLATPAVRRLARELGVDLASVVGSGERGRVLADDVRRFAASPESTESAVAAVSTLSTGAPRADRGAGDDGVAPLAVEADERRPLVGIRKRIAENMARSWSHAVQVTVVEEVVVDELVALRERINAHLGEQRISYLPIFVKAAASLLARFPELNASLDEEASELVYHAHRNIGIAVDDPQGLMVPVVRDADRRSIRELGLELERLIQGARAHTLGPRDLTGSTFTITNFGSIGGIVATPIINYPDVAILGVGPIRRRAVVGPDDVIVPASVLFVSLTFDHRVVDGGTASRFLVALSELLRDPAALVAELV